MNKVCMFGNMLENLQYDVTGVGKVEFGPGPENLESNVEA